VFGGMVEQLSQCDASQRIVSRIWFEPVFEKAARASGGPVASGRISHPPQPFEAFSAAILVAGLKSGLSWT
jgi:hypothetical protein